MKRQKISLNQRKNITLEEKQQQIANNLTDFTEEDYLFTVNYVFLEFLVHQEEKGNSQATIDYYKRFYKKFSSFLSSIDSDVKETPIAIENTDNKYFISNYGRVKSYCGYSAIVLKPYLQKYGYLEVKINDKNFKIH